MNQEHSKSLLFVAVLVLTGLVYAIGLDGPFVFDDVDNLKPLNRWLSGELGWLRVVFDNGSGLLGRPVSMASFVFNTWLFGPSIWGFKATNLGIHLTNGLLVYRLFCLFLERRLLTSNAPDVARWLPIVGAAIWLLHPLFVSTVLYVVQRMAMLSTMFMLLALIAYILGRTALDRGEHRRTLIWLFLVAPLCTLLACFSKENGILTPALCALIEWFAFPPKEGTRRARASQLVLVFGLWVPAAVAVALVIIQPPLIAEGFANRPFTLSERLLTQTRVLWSYVSSLLLPMGPQLGLYHDDFPLSRGLTKPWTTAPAILGWIVTIGLAFRLRHAVPGFAMGIGFFLIGHSLESSIFPLLMYFEHRNYLPAIGLIWALVSLGTAAALRLAPFLDHGGKIARFAGISLILALAVATAARASVWGSQQAILMQGLKHHPTSRWLRIDLAQESMYRSPPDYREAREHVDALILSPDESTRRIAGAWQLMIACASNTPVERESLQRAFGERLTIMEADLLITFESLGSNVVKAPCIGLDQATLATALVSMLDAASLPPRHFNIRRIRFKSSQLFMAAGDPENALIQARLAYTGAEADAPIGIFLAELEAVHGSKAAAVSLVQHLDKQLQSDDLTGRRILDGVREQLLLKQNH